MPMGIYTRKLKQTTKNRFYSHVNIKEDDDCWEWTAVKNQKGYGRFKVNGVLKSAHRVAWILNYGEIPKGMEVLHKCDNRGCCNHGHLFLGTQKDNVSDMFAKGRDNHLKGSLHPNAKLSEKDILEIRQSILSGETYKQLAVKYRVSNGLISHIVNKRSWLHV